MQFRVYHQRPIVALFRLGFPLAAVLRTLTEPLTVTRRIIMQKARRHALRLPAIALRPLVGTWFQVHIPPLTGVLLIFRSLYLFTIGHQGVFSLTGWSPSIQSRFHVTRPTQGTLQRQQAFAYGSVTLYGRPFQIVLLADCLITPVEGPTTPRWKPPRFGLFPFRSPLLRKSIFLSFPAGTEMFQFSALATATYEFSCSQFGHPGIITCLTVTPGLSQSSTPFKAS